MKAAPPPIFLVGCPRSGTTLLQSLLGAHSHIAVFPETKFFQHLDACYEPKRHRLGLRSRRLPGRLRTFFGEELQRPDLLSRFPRSDRPWSLWPRPYVRSFLAVMQELTQAQGKRRFLEKTPDHVYHLACVERWVPQAIVLHLVREGADVVASLYGVSQRSPQLFGGKPRSIETCIDNWRQAIRASRRCIGKANHGFVDYGHLTADSRGWPVARCRCRSRSIWASPQITGAIAGSP
ncbi:sulfotransferase family protein, partial [Prochlorothrix hollandica]|uniref:sulfotransferase family protein n=1 Tax=Prochlorothrix hollandica TaxID=1223 RepID=UPI00333FD702